MDKANRNMRERFRREFEHFEIQPSEKVWKGINRALFRNQFLRFNFESFNIYYLSAILFTGLVTSFVLYTENKKSEDASTSAETLVPVPGIQESVNQDLPRNLSVLPDNNASKEESQLIKNNTYPGRSIKSQDSIVIPTPSLNLFSEREKAEEKSLEPSPEFIPNNVPVSYFTVSSREGCAPLPVTFANHSENAMQYSWSFGDGGISIEKNPSYIFDEPGTYFVNLTVLRKDGNVSMYTDSIQVFPLPEVRFDIDSGVIPGSGQPIIFYNYTQGAEYFEWHFGDGSTSVEKDPAHYYKKPGNYRITLIAQNIHGCRDSFVLNNVFSEKEPSIHFPNAFAPDRNGPSNGRYNSNDISNHIFHPVTGEEVEEYQLKIFNRKGILIFESNEILQGWDGYFMQELQPQGVYVWKVRGRFANGRSFVKIGDVTLIWSAER